MKNKKVTNQEVCCSEDEIMYRFFLGGIPVLFILYWILTKTNIGPEWLQGCLLHDLTGLYCPGCGATRAVSFLVQGQIGKSLFYYPAAAPTALFMFIYIVSHTLSKITSGKIKAMHYRRWYILIPVLLIIGNWIWKNYYYIVKHISLIP